MQDFPASSVYWGKKKKIQNKAPHRKDSGYPKVSPPLTGGDEGEGENEINNGY